MKIEKKLKIERGKRGENQTKQKHVQHGVEKG